MATSRITRSKESEDWSILIKANTMDSGKQAASKDRACLSIPIKTSTQEIGSKEKNTVKEHTSSTPLE